MALTPKQQRFCEEYLIDMNGTQAAIRAGYQPSNANVYSSELLADPNISEYLNHLRNERSIRTKIDADWLLARLAAEAVADVKDIFDDEGNLKPVAEWPEMFRVGLVTGIDVEREKVEVSTRETGQAHDERVIEAIETRTRITKVKLSDRIKRLELIGRHIGVQAFRDKVAVEGPIVIQVLPEDGDL